MRYPWRVRQAENKGRLGLERRIVNDVRTYFMLSWCPINVTQTFLGTLSRNSSGTVCTCHGVLHYYSGWKSILIEIRLSSKSDRSSAFQQVDQTVRPLRAPFFVLLLFTVAPLWRNIRLSDFVFVLEFVFGSQSQSIPCFQIRSHCPHTTNILCRWYRDSIDYGIVIKLRHVFSSIYSYAAGYQSGWVSISHQVIDRASFVIKEQHLFKTLHSSYLSVLTT